MLGAFSLFRSASAFPRTDRRCVPSSAKSHSISPLVYYKYGPVQLLWLDWNFRAKIIIEYNAIRQDQFAKYFSPGCFHHITKERELRNSREPSRALNPLIVEIRLWGDSIRMPQMQQARVYHPDHIFSSALLSSFRSFASLANIRLHTRAYFSHSFAGCLPVTQKRTTYAG